MAIDKNVKTVVGGIERVAATNLRNPRIRKMFGMGDASDDALKALQHGVGPDDLSALIGRQQQHIAGEGASLIPSRMGRAGGAAAGKQAAKAVSVGDKIEHAMNIVEAPMDAVGAVVGIGGEMGLGALSMGAAAIGQTTLAEKIWSPMAKLQNPITANSKITWYSALFDIPFVITSAFQMFRGVNGLTKQIDSLETLDSKLTGQKRGMWELLTSNKVSHVIKSWRQEAYKKILQLGIKTVGFGMILRGMYTGKSVGLMGVALPHLLSQGVETLLGSSGPDYYTQMNELVAHNQAIPLEVYSQFLILSSSELESRGHIGKLVADKLAGDYAKEKATPDQILAEIEGGAKGKFMERAHAVIGSAEAEHAAIVKAAQDRRAKMEAYKKQKEAPHAAGSTPHADTHTRPAQPVVGDYTGRLKQRADQQQHIAPGVA